MGIRMFEVYTWDRLLIYFGACGLMPTVLAASAAAFNRWVLPGRAWAIMGVVLAAFWAIGARLFQTRRHYQRSIDFYTPQGVAVVGTWLARDARVWAELPGVVDEVIEYFALRHQDVVPGRYTSIMAAEERLRDHFNGVHLGVSVERLVWHGQGEGTRGMHLVARGLARGKWAAVQWAPGEPLEVVLGLVRHELGHLAVEALGGGGGKADFGEQDHRLFARIGWNW